MVFALNWSIFCSLCRPFATARALEFCERPDPKRPMKSQKIGTRSGNFRLAGDPGRESISG